MHISPVFAPDGMTNPGRGMQRHDNDRFDDGLVHNHNWAVNADGDAMVTERGSFRPAYVGAMQPDRSDVRASSEADDRFDDGLVHNHDWAVSGK